jgi:hypothetical protein
VSRNSPAIAYSIHTLEKSAGGRSVTRLHRAGHPAVACHIVTGLGFIGALLSVARKAAIPHGRKRLIVIAMLASFPIGATIGFVGGEFCRLAAVLPTVYSVVIWLASSTLSAGTAGPSRRGAILAVHQAWLRGRVYGAAVPLLVVIHLRRDANACCPPPALGAPGARA